MQKVSRTLLLAGVLAFGGLTAACDNGTTTVTGPIGVQSVTLTPPSATIVAGSTIQLAVSVVADAATAKTVTYTTSAAGVATVDATGRVTGVAAGTATIIATSTADASKAAASVITVTGPSVPIVPVPTIAINSVTDVNGNPVTLNNVNGQVNVTVNTSGGGLIEVFLSTSCASNTIGASDVAVASQQATSAQPGSVTLSFNTAQLTAATPPAPRFPNGNYCIKARLTNGTQVVVATNTVPLTLNNANVFTGTLAFASVTGGPTTAVSTINGLNYNQGTLTVTLNPVIFTGSSPAVFITGTLTRNGEIAGAGVADLNFTNAAVTNGVATIVFTDTSATGVNTIFGYTSLPAGDTLYVSAATDAAGNPIAVGAGGIPVAVTGGSGVRIDNQTPGLNGATFQVTAPNGYIPATYVFSTGTTGTPSDVHPPVGGNPGVGGVTITYYIGAATAAAFGTANSCNITGLTAATNTSSLANTTSTNANKAKVVVKDALGNQVCADAPSTLVGGGGAFGVDKIMPEASFVTTTVNALAGVADQTGYNASRGFNLSFRDSISGFPQAAGSSPFTGTVKRVTAVAPVAADCVVGTFVVASGACNDVAISTANVPSWFETTQAGSSFLLGGFQFTNGTGLAGYYTANLTTTDVAGNVLPAIARTAAFDATVPGAGAPTQAAPAVPFGSVTVTSAATDNLTLISSRGNLSYGALATFARVSGNTLGTFGQIVTGATATVTLPNVYRGMQDGSSGTIGAAVTLPSATVTVTDVGGNSTTSAASTVTTTTASTAIALALPPVGTQFTLTSSAANGVAGASVATTNLTLQINGASNDAAFQSQPFNGVEIYKLNTTTAEYALVASITAATVVDNTTTGVRTYSYVASGVALSAGPGATNTYIAVAHNAAGDAVRSPAVTQLNP